MIFSAKGSIHTSLAMMDCASSQSGPDVFLLSELEKIWAALSTLIQQRLIEGKNARIAQFGSFWLEDFPLITDAQHRKYKTRKICFAVHRTMALRYHINTEKVPVEKRSLTYSTIHPSEIVALCEVPANRVVRALRDFFLYIGEGLYSQRVYNLKFPGVATLLLRKDQMLLTVESEMQQRIFEVDSRRWPREMREHCLKIMEELAESAASSCTTPRSARSVSWRAAPPTIVDPTHVFNPAAPSGRNFSDIEREAARQSERLAKKREALQHYRRACQVSHRDASLDSCVNAGVCGRSQYYDPCALPPSPHTADSSLSRPHTGESIYRLLSDTQVPEDAEASDDDIEIEVEEVAAIPKQPAPAEGCGNPSTDLPVEKDISPSSSRRSYHDHCSVKDLIYNYYDGEVNKNKRENKARIGNESLAQFGRKRFDVGQPETEDPFVSVVKKISTVPYHPAPSR